MSNVLGSAVVKIDVQLTGMDQISALHGALGRVAAARGVVQRLSAIGVAANQMGQQVRQLSFVLRDAGRQFLAFGGILAAGLLGVAKVSATFEQSIANTRAVISELTDNTPEASRKLQTLSETIIDVARASRFTATEVAGASEQLGLAGFKAQEVIDSLTGVINLAAAGSTNLADATRISANAIRAWALDASHAARIADVFAAAATNSNTTILSLGEGLKQVSSTAAVFGISIEETATALALLGDAGLRGSIGGTSLNRLLLQLAEGSGNLTDLLDKVGVSADKINPLKVSLEEIVAVFRDLLSTGKIAADELANAFDIRAARALLVLTKTSAERFDDMADAIKNAAGEAEKIANIKLDTVEGAFLLLKSAVEALVDAIGKTFQEELKAAIRQITESAKKTFDWVKANKELIKSFIITAAKVSVFAIVVGAVLTVLGSVAAAFAALILIGATLATVMAFVTAAFLAAGGAANFFLASATIATGGLFLLVAVVGLLVIGIIKLVKWLFGMNEATAETPENFEEMRKEADLLADAIDGVATSMSRQISAQERLNEIIAKGSDINEKELKELPELLSRGASFDPDDLEDRIQKAETLIAGFNQNITDIFGDGTTALSAAEQAKISALNQQVTQLESFVERTTKSLEQLKAVSLQDEFKEFEFGGGGSNNAFKKFLADRAKLAQDAADKLREEIRRGNRDDDKLEALNSLSILEKEADDAKSRLTLAELFDPAAFNAFVDAIRAGQGPVEQFKAALDVKEATKTLLEYNNELKKTQEEAMEAREALDEEVDSFLGKGVESKFEEAKRLSEALKADTADRISAEIEIGQNNLALAGGSFLERAAAHAREAARIAQIVLTEGAKLTQQQLALDAKRQELLDEQVDKQKKTVRDTQKQKAEADKDINTLERIIREERQEKLQADLEAGGFNIDPAANADAQTLADTARRRAEFEKNFNDETDREIENRKKQFEDEAARAAKAASKQKTVTQNSTERLEVEKSITSELIKQVKTFEDVARAMQFARNIQKQRERDARLALTEQGQREKRLLELQDRRNELAKQGKDTTRLDRQLAVSRRLVGLNEGFVNNAAEDAGNKNAPGKSPLLDQFDTVEKDSRQLLEDAKAKAAAAATVVNVFGTILETFRLAPEGWAKALIDSWNRSISGFEPRLPSPDGSGSQVVTNSVLPSTIPGGRIPGLPGSAMAQTGAIGTQNNNDNRNITIEINGANATPDEIAKSVFDAISQRQFA